MMKVRFHLIIKMKVIIAGTRDITDEVWIHDILDKCHKIDPITEVVSGRARGPDTFGETWAKKNNIHVEPFPADWKKYGKRAGPLRNAEMAEYADRAMIFWDGKSSGTNNMIAEMKVRKKPYQLFLLNIKRANEEFLGGN